MIKKITYTLILALSSIAVFAVPPAGIMQSIDAMIAASRRAPGFSHARIGISIISLNDDATWYAKNAKAQFIPASTAKAVTAAMALEHLPADFRFTTRVFINGDVTTEGLLNGDLILQGGGDPSLTVNDLAAIAQTIAMGDTVRNIPAIHQVLGRVIYDDSYFPRRGPLLGMGWEKSDLPWYYAAPSNALSINRNAVTVTVRGTTPGQPAQVIVSPQTQLFTIDNRAMTQSTVKTGAVEVTPDGFNIRITGNIAPDTEMNEEISVLDPIKFVNEQFQQSLTAAGVMVLGSEATGAIDPTRRTLIVEHQSATIPEIIHPMLKESDNHFAEQLRWTMLAELQQDMPLSRRYDAILRAYEARIGMEARAFTLVDGSGLSRLNQFSPAAITRVLDSMAAAPQFTAFFESLPIAGVDGTLQKRMIGTPAAGNVHAKTGTMRGVCTLAGYVTTRSGEQLAFAVFANGYQNGATTARSLQDNIAAYLAGVE